MTAIRPASVIICTHNRADLLQEVVSQLRAQVYPQGAFEIIVVDNGSTDHTPQVVDRLAAEPGAPVRYVAESRIGITFARNRGAEEAYYPYLVYIDDDCSVGPDWLQQLMNGFDLHEHVVAVGGQVLLHWDQQEKPSWFAPQLERWLAANSYLGTHSRLLAEDERIIECNMALERKAWQAAGGFLGMEQFGSQHMAASEVVYLFMQLHRQGGKIAFVPEAVVHHHVGIRTRQWMLQRAYWQGVSDAVLAHLLHRRSWVSIAYGTGLDLAALLVLLGYTTAAYLSRDSAKGLFHLMRAVRRVGLLLGELRIVGDWHRTQSWFSEQNETK
jgi:glycosyltransferase involved in cell wall biosynthesis